MPAPLTLTLNAIRAQDPCVAGWAKLLEYLGKSGGDDEPLLLETVLDSNGVIDALWCLRALPPEHARTVRLFAVWCARQAQHLMPDARSLRALDVAEAYANGKATPKESKAAADAAYAAAYAAGAAPYAAYAAGAAAYAPYAADTAGAAAYAAGAAAYAACAATAGAAAYAACAATAVADADAAYAATYAADAARSQQAAKLREICRAGFIGSDQKEPS